MADTHGEHIAIMGLNGEIASAIAISALAEQSWYGKNSGNHIVIPLMEITLGRSQATSSSAINV